MSGPLKINLNSTLAIYHTFASESKNEKDVCVYVLKRADGTPRIINLSKLDKDLEKNSSSKMVSESACQNDITRYHFFKSVADQFGGANNIPPKVQEALRKNGFGDVEFIGEVKRSQFITGTPLKARDIKAVIKAISSATRADVELLAGNLANDIRKCLSSGKINTEEFKQSLKRFFDAALPPKWNTSKNFDAQILKDFFGTDSIRNLKERVFALVERQVKIAREGGFDKKGTSKCLAELKTVLTSMQVLFADSKVGKDKHVAAFLNKFNDVINDFGQNQSDNSAQKDDLGAKLETSIEQKRENLLKPLFSKNELMVLEQIAKCARGNSLNDEGGSGCIAFMGGSPVNFFTKLTKRMEKALAGLSNEEKSKITTATQQLRKILVSCANKISADMGEIVTKFLAPKLQGDLDLIKCTDVVKALSYMRPFLTAEGHMGEIEFTMGGKIKASFPGYSDLKGMAKASSEYGKNTAVRVKCNHEGGWNLEDFSALTTNRVGKANEGSLVVVTKLEDGKEVDYLQRTYDDKSGKAREVSKAEAERVCELLSKAVKQGLDDIVAKMYMANVPENILSKQNNAFRMLHDNNNYFYALTNIETMNGGYKPMECKRIGMLVQRIQWLKKCSVDELVAMSAAKNKDAIALFLSTENEKTVEEFKSKFTVKDSNPKIKVEEQIEDLVLPESPFGEIESPVVKPNVQSKPVIEPSLVKDYEAVTAKLEKCNLLILQSVGMEFLKQIFPNLAVPGEILLEYLDASTDQERKKLLDIMHSTHDPDKDPLFNELIAEPYAKQRSGQISSDEYQKIKYNLYLDFAHKKLSNICETLNAFLGKTVVTYNSETRSFSFGKSAEEARAALKDLITLVAKRNDGLYTINARALGVDEKQAALKTLNEHLIVVEGPLGESSDGVISKLGGCDRSRLQFASLNFLKQVVPELAKYCQFMLDYPDLRELRIGSFRQTGDKVAEEIWSKYNQSPWNKEEMRYRRENPPLSPSGEEIEENVKKNKLKEEECFRLFLGDEIAGILKPINDNLKGGKITFDSLTRRFSFGKNENEARKILTALVADYATKNGFFSQIGLSSLDAEAKTVQFAKLANDLSLVDEPFVEDYGKLSQAMANYQQPALRFAGEEFLKQIFPDLAKYLTCWSDFMRGSKAERLAVVEALEKNTIQISNGRKFSKDSDLADLEFLGDKIDNWRFVERKFAIFQRFITQEINSILVKTNVNMAGGELTFDPQTGEIDLGETVENVRRSLQELVVAYAKKESALPQLGALDLDVETKHALLAKITNDLAAFKEKESVPSKEPVPPEAVVEKAPIQEEKPMKRVAQEPTVLKIPNEPKKLGILADEGNELSSEFKAPRAVNDNAVERSFDPIWNEHNTREWISRILNLFTDYSLELKDADAYTRKAYLELLGKINEILERNEPDWRLFATVQNEIEWFNGQAIGDEKKLTSKLFNNLTQCMALADNYYRNSSSNRGHAKRPVDWVNYALKLEPDPRLGVQVAPFSPGVIEVNKVRTNLSIEEVGGTAPSHNVLLPWPSGLGPHKIYDYVVWKALEINCKGTDCRQGFALAFNLLSDHLPGLRNATDVFKSDYLALLIRAEGIISQADSKDSTRLYVALSREIQTLFAKYSNHDPDGQERTLLSAMHEVLMAVWHFYGAKEDTVPPQNMVQLKNFTPEKLGVKATAFDSQLYERGRAREVMRAGIGLNHMMLTRELQVNCRGRDCLQWIAYALNLASEKNMLLRGWNAKQRQDYLFLLNECRKNIASVYQHRGDTLGILEMEDLRPDEKDGLYVVGDSKRKISADVYYAVTDIIGDARTAYMVLNKNLNAVRGRQNTNSRIVESVKGMLPGGVNGAEIEVVDNSGKNFNCLFYSIQKCLDGGGAENDDAAQALRIQLHDKARQVIDSASNSNYGDAFRQAARNKDYPYFKEDITKIALMDYLVDVERKGLNIFADASLLSLVPDIIHRPVVLLNDLSQGKGENFRTNTYKSGNAEWDANEPIYIYYNGFNHYKSVVVKRANVNAG